MLAQHGTVCVGCTPRFYAWHVFICKGMLASYYHHTAIVFILYSFTSADNWGIKSLISACLCEVNHCRE